MQSLKRRFVRSPEFITVSTTAHHWWLNGHTYALNPLFFQVSSTCLIFQQKFVRNFYRLRFYVSCTRWFKYDRDWLCVNKSQFVPVIFEPPCTISTSLFFKNNNNNKVKYKSSSVAIQRMWNTKCKHLEAIPGKHSTDSLQETAVLGTSHIMRKVLQSETGSMSGGDHRWLKRWSTGRKDLWHET